MRYYKNLEFKQNDRSDKIIKSEIPHFYVDSDFIVGSFYRVQLPKILSGEEYEPSRYINTFLFLNPKLNEKICWGFYRYSVKSMVDFNITPDDFTKMLQDKKKITYKNCYSVFCKIIYDENHIRKQYKLSVYSKSYIKDLYDILNNEKKDWIDQANKELLKNSFFELINNVALSYEKLALENKMLIEDVEKYLNMLGIYIREEELEFLVLENKYDENGKVIGVSKSTKKIIKRQSYKDYIIEKQIKYLLNKPNELFNLNDIVNGCNYYSEYYDIEVQIDKGYIREWINNNKLYKRFIKHHITEFNKKKKLITRQNKIMVILYHLTPKNKVYYSRNENGKVIATDFGEEFNGDYSEGNNKIYAHKYDIDEELGDEEFEL